MVKNADFLICDSKSIEEYIHEDYRKYNPQTTFIAYGADITPSTLRQDDKKVVDWFNKHDVKLNEYFLIVGRFVPENNYETMIKEFMKSKVNKDLVIITNVEKNAFYNSLKEETHFENDKRIKFVGTVYDAELLKFIRENALGYLHGHSVGGTNPSLLEALGSTKINLLYNVGFNKEVGEDSSLYWSLEDGSLANKLNEVEEISAEKEENFGKLAKQQIIDNYSWKKIVNDYEEQFMRG